MSKLDFAADDIHRDFEDGVFVHALVHIAYCGRTGSDVNLCISSHSAILDLYKTPLTALVRLSPGLLTLENLVARFAEHKKEVCCN